MRLPRSLTTVAAGVAIACWGSFALSSGAHARTIEGTIAYIGQEPQGPGPQGGKGPQAGKGAKDADTMVHIGNKGYRVSTRPKVLIAGRPADLSEIKPRMKCKVTLSHNEAREFICNRRPIAEF